MTYVELFKSSLFTAVYSSKTGAAIVVALLIAAGAIFVYRPKRILFWKNADDLSIKRNAYFRKISLLVFSVIFLVGTLSWLFTFRTQWTPGGIFYVGYALFFIAPLFLWGARSGVLGFLAMACFEIATFVFLSGFMNLVPDVIQVNPERTGAIVEKDDLLEDKHPLFISAFTQKMGTAFFNKSDAVIKISVDDSKGRDDKITREIFADFGDAMAAAEKSGIRFLPSVDFIAGHDNYLDDRVMAALETHIHEGSSLYPGGKQGFLTDFLAAVLALPEDSPRDQAAGYLAAALELGGKTVATTQVVEAAAKGFRERFLQNPRYSMPIGFYAESEELKKIFQRDRFLQKPFGVSQKQDGVADFYSGDGFAPAVRMAQVLAANPEMASGYKKFLDLAQNTGNPAANLSLDALLPHTALFNDESELFYALKRSKPWRRARLRGNTGEVGVAFWPYATSREARLFSWLFEGQALPDCPVMDQLVDQIKRGHLELEPTGESGWYDHQICSLKTLLLPDKGLQFHKHLLTADYKTLLRHSFEGMLAENREAHLKGLFAPVMPPDDAGEINGPAISPKLSVQPAATHFLKMARGYQFLAEALRESMGEAELNSIPVKGFGKNLLALLDENVLFHYGLFFVVCDDLAMGPFLKYREVEDLPALAGRKGDLEVARKELIITKTGRLDDGTRIAWHQAWKVAKMWLENLSTAPFLKQDPRILLPVLSNSEKTEYRYWGVLGVRLVKLRVQYAVAPRLSRDLDALEKAGGEDLDAMRKNPPDCHWAPTDYLLPIKLSAEFTLEQSSPTHEAFIAACDNQKSEKEILRALGAKTNIVLYLMLAALALFLVAGYYVTKNYLDTRQARKQP